jgi:hypothetical protein
MIIPVHMSNYYGPMLSFCMSCEPWYDHNMCISVCSSATACPILPVVFGRPNTILMFFSNNRTNMSSHEKHIRICVNQ